MFKKIMDLFKPIGMPPPPEPEVTEYVSRAGRFSTDEITQTNAQNRKTMEDYVAQRTFQRKATDDIAPGVVVAQDSISNNLKLDASCIFSGVPDAQLGWYASQSFIGYQMCAILAQQWLISKACSLPGRDAARKGYEVTVNDGNTVSAEVLDRIKTLDEYYCITKNLEEFSKFNRVFGIRIAMFDIDTPDPDDYYFKPFNLDGITPGSYKGISQIDPYWITPELSNQAVSNPAAIDFYEPTWWRVNGRRIHKSHLIIIRHEEVADILKPTYLYGGISLCQKIYERVYAAERTANEAPLLALTKRLNVYKADIENIMANQGEFEQRLQYRVRMRDNFGVLVIDKEEEVEQFDLNLTDFDVTMMNQYQLVAAIAETPAQKLLGTTPKGFNATGEYEEASYHELCEIIQKHDFTPLLQRHHEILIRSEIAPKFGIEPFSTKIVWEKLDSYTTKEQAEINEMNSRTISTYINAGVIDGQEARENLIADKESGFSGLDIDKVIEVPGENDPFGEGLEDFGLENADPAGDPLETEI